MGGPSVARCALVAVALGLVTAGLVPPLGALAVDSPPQERGVLILDGPSLDGLTADIDGDGRIDLVRLVPWSADTSRLALEVWQQRSSGAWRSSGQVPLSRKLSAQEVVDGTPVPSAQFGPVSLTDGARLLRFRIAGVDRVLVAVTHRPTDLGLPPCCLTGWIVRLANGGPDLQLAFAETIGASAILAIDMDADGTDELVVRAGSPQGPEIHLLHRNGTAFEDSGVRRDPGNPGTLVLLGNTDGRPGDEAALAGTFESGSGGAVFGLMRVSMRDGRIHLEQEEVDRAGMAIGVPSGDGGRGLIAYGDDESALALLDWPSDGIPRVVASTSLHGEPIAVLGSGSGQRIVVRSAADGVARYRLVNPSLALASAQEIAPSPAAAPLPDDVFAPYAGPWPVGDGDAPTFVAAGRRLVVDGSGSVEIAANSVAAMSGSVPLGIVGHGDEIAVMQTVEAGGLGPAGMPRDRGGDLLVSQAPRIAIVPRELVETAERDGGRLTPVVLDAVRDPSVQDGSALLIDTPTFIAALDAPTGSIVRTNAGGLGPITVLEPQTVPPAPGINGGPPFRVEVAWAASNKSGKPFTASLVLVTPAAHAYTATWRVRWLAGGPHVSGEGAFITLGFGAGISGQADPGSTVTVEGRAMQTDVSGRFEGTAPGGILPRDVQVVATDPFGRRTAIRVSVVSPIDYRRLPWIPIAALGTIAAGLVLFLRVPRGRSRPIVEAPASDGALEEIDGDRV